MGFIERQIKLDRSLGRPIKQIRKAVRLTSIQKKTCLLLPEIVGFLEIGRISEARILREA
jgi:hypothetical protein